MVKSCFGEKIFADLPFAGLGLSLKTLLDQVKHLRLKPIIKISGYDLWPEHQRPAGIALLIFLNREIRGS
jgi:hypothetical protein